MAVIRKLVICILVIGTFGIPLVGTALSSAYVGRYFEAISQNPPCCAPSIIDSSNAVGFVNGSRNVSSGSWSYTSTGSAGSSVNRTSTLPLQLVPSVTANAKLSHSGDPTQDATYFMEIVNTSSAMPSLLPPNALILQVHGSAVADGASRAYWNLFFGQTSLAATAFIPKTFSLMLANRTVTALILTVTFRYLTTLSLY